MPTLLTSRQEAFCRNYAVSGNAAGAARAAGYSEACARQQGYENLQKPFVLIRLDEIRRGFAETAGREAAILLDRMERIWPLAAGNANVHAMLMTVGLEAKLAGLLGDADTKVRLWGPDGQAGPLERAAERAGDGQALAAAEAAAPRDPARARRRDAPPAHVFEDELEPDGVAADDDAASEDSALWHADAGLDAGEEADGTDRVDGAGGADGTSAASADREGGTAGPDIAASRPPVRRRSAPSTGRGTATKGPHPRPLLPAPRNEVRGKGSEKQDGAPTEPDRRARVAA